MSIFRRVALQELKNNRARTLVTIAGVALSAALITAVATFAVSLQAYMIRGAIQKYGGWHVEIPDVTREFIEAQAGDSRVEAIAGWQNVGYAPLDGGQNPDKPYLFIAGFDEETLKTAPVTVFSGRLPENDGEVLIPAHVASNGGVRFAIGDTVTLPVGERESDGRRLSQCDPWQGDSERLTGAAVRTFTVVGICQRLFAEPRTAPGYTLITRASGAASGSRTALVTLKHPSQIGAYVKAVAPNSRWQINGEVLRFMGLSEDTKFNALLYAMSGVLIALVMIGSIFLIYNAFSISLSERVRQFGLLMSVGATKRQLRDSVLFEGLCIGAAGIPLGILAGLPGIRLVLALVAKNFAKVLYSGVSLSLVVSAPALIAAAAVSLITILISAWIPARRAASMPVMACIRQTGEIRVDARAVRTSPLAQRLWGLNGTLALKNFRRNRGRYRSVILSLTLSVVLTVAASSFGGYLKQISDRAYVYTNYDIAFSAPELADEALPDLFAALGTADGVTGGNYQLLRDYAVRPDSGLLTQAYWDATGRQPSGAEEMTAEVQLLNDDAYRALLGELGLSEDGYGPDSGRWLALGKVFVETGGPREAYEVPDLFTEPEVRLSLLPLGGAEGAALAVDLALAEFSPPDTPPVTRALNQVPILMIFAPWSARAAFPGTDVRAKGLTFTSVTPGQTTGQMQEIIYGLGLAGAYSLLNVHEMLDQSRNLTFIARLFSAIFIAMITLIAVANVFNTISTNIRLRRRELAMLRSVGMGDRDFNRMMRFECALYGLRTVLLGLPVSLLLSWGMYRMLDDGYVTFAPPWLSMAASAAGVVVIVSVTMLYATRRLMRENIIDALRDDMN